MSRFNGAKRLPTQDRVTSPIRSVRDLSAYTEQGAPGFVRDAKGELFLLGVANFYGADAFYEKGKERDARFVELVRQLAMSEPVWTAGFLKWLRTEANMRTVAIVGAAEFVKARLEMTGRYPFQDGINRKVIDAVLVRADEPGELLAYWINTYGKAIPKPIKRGVADAVGRLYTERNLLKYDTGSKAVRFGDVLELTHAKPTSEWQSKLFKYAIDSRQGNVEAAKMPFDLPMIERNRALRYMVAGGANGFLLDQEAVRAAGLTWEDVLSLGGDKLNKAELWEAVIPSMGVMALVRNLRNFDDAGISRQARAEVMTRIIDPEAVRLSRMFPFRFLAAHRNTHTLNWASSLEEALNLSLANVPELPGRTLILVDQSGSMIKHAGGSLSDMKLADVAQVFGSALALRASKATLVQFDDASSVVPFRKGQSLLRLTDSFQGPRGGTYTKAALDAHFDGHDRVIILTDEQTALSGSQGYTFRPAVDSSLPAETSVYVWNLAGYRFGSLETGVSNRHVFGSLSDASFRLIPLIEAAGTASWPWENDAA